MDTALCSYIAGYINEADYLNMRRFETYMTALAEVGENSGTPRSRLYCNSKTVNAANSANTVNYENSEREEEEEEESMKRMLKLQWSN